jgi:quercetin dioxygenase-like cupin family protein
MMRMSPRAKERTMFSAKNDSALKILREGIRFKTVAAGDKTHLAEFHRAKGTVIPEHAHPQEQTGYLVSGRLTFRIEDETFEVRPLDGWNIGGGIPHGVDTLEDSVVIEVFSPPREDYLALSRTS